GVVIGEVGELAPTGDVADGVDAPVFGLEALVDHDPVAVAGDAGLLERQAVSVRPAAGRDQQMAALDCLFAIAGKDDLDLSTCAFDARDLDVAAHDHALA